MNYKYEIINYDRNVPSKIMYLNLSSDTHKTELHWHREPELIYVVEGVAECPCNASVHVISAGQIAFFNSEDVHLVRPVNGESAKMICVQLSYEYMRLFCHSLENIIFDIDISQSARIELTYIMKNIAELEVEDDEYAVLMQISYVNHLYYILLKNCIVRKQITNKVVAPRRDFSYAKTAISYINENFKREITLNEISDVVNLSPSYFSKYFKSVTKVSFSDYLANLRLENALQDMLQKNSTVASAALENGFANVKSFITQCKKVYGYTPAQYKKHILNK